MRGICKRKVNYFTNNNRKAAIKLHMANIMYICSNDQH